MKLIATTLLLIFLISCKEKTIFKDDRKWVYEITNTLNDDIDTVEMKVKSGWLDSKMTWRSESKYESGLIKKKFKVTSDFDEYGNVIVVRPLSIDVLKKTEIMPYPQIRFPIKKGDINRGPFHKIKSYKYEYSYYSEDTKTGKSVKENNHNVPNEEFIDIEYKGFIKVADKIFEDKFNDSVWVLESESVTEKYGTFKAIYHFSEKIGFTKFEYDFGKYKANVKLIKVIS